MTLKQYIWSLPAFILIAFVYAWVTQPYFGPSSVSSVIARSLAIVFWLLLFLVVRKIRFEHWSWTNFWMGSLVGGGWLMAAFPMVIQESPITVSLALVYCAISGLFASGSATTLRAAITGICVFAGQFGIDFCVFALGWSKFNFGM